MKLFQIICEGADSHLLRGEEIVTADARILSDELRRPYRL
jgi:hypothetical protein